MPSHPKSLIGEKFNRLTVISRAPNQGRSVIWNCLCECGVGLAVLSSNLITNHTKSCGCLQKENRYKHGMCGTALYCTWLCVLSRCNNPNNVEYENYGGRGISVCKEWLTASVFLSWAKGKWRKGLQIDRRNNDGDYEPSNCRFVTPSINSINQRKKRNNTSGYTGVSYYKSYGKYRSYITCQHVVNWLGYFDKPEQAVAARNDFIIKNNLPHKIQEIR